MSHRSRFSRSVVSFAGVLFLVVSCVALPARASQTGCEDRVNTQPVTFSVVLSDNNTYQIAGFLYWNGRLEGKVLQIAVHGGTYNHKYWDADELNGHDYSYARYMACHGFAVLTLDSLGVGASSKPDGDFVTIPVQADALHQVIQSLGSEPVAASFRKVVLVGHSIGSEQANYEQGTYHDADGLVVTNWENAPHQVDFSQDAIAALLGSPYGYLPPADRTHFFYAGDYDPAMPDYDNEFLADFVSRGSFTYTIAVLMGFASTHSEGVQAPVLLVFDEFDALEPFDLAGGEAATYPNAASVTTHRVYGIGHDLNLHLANLDEWAQIKAWIRQTVDGSTDD